MLERNTLGLSVFLRKYSHISNNSCCIIARYLRKHPKESSGVFLDRYSGFLVNLDRVEEALQIIQQIPDLPMVKRRNQRRQKKPAERVLKMKTEKQQIPYVSESRAQTPSPDKIGMAKSNLEKNEGEDVDMGVIKDDLFYKSFAAGRMPIRKKQKQRKNWTPREPYVLIGRSVIEELARPRRANDTTHLSLAEIIEAYHVPGPFLMLPENKHYLGSPENSSSGRIGYRVDRVANVLIDWLGEAGKTFRENNPYMPKTHTDSFDIAEKDDWISTLEIMTEYELEADTLQRYIGMFGQPKYKRDHNGRRLKLFRRSCVVKSLDNMERELEIDAEKETDL